MTHDITHEDIQKGIELGRQARGDAARDFGKGIAAGIGWLGTKVMVGFKSFFAANNQRIQNFDLSGFKTNYR